MIKSRTSGRNFENDLDTIVAGLLSTPVLLVFVKFSNEERLDWKRFNQPICGLPMSFSRLSTISLFLLFLHRFSLTYCVTTLENLIVHLTISTNAL